jgi:DNA mismatch repair ATPase MutS
MKNKLYRTASLAIVSFLSIVLQISSIYAAFEPVEYDAGKARVFQVMYQGPGGIEDVNRKTLYAETKNLAFDLNLSEISTRFGCKTQMGQGFIAKTLAKPISPLDKNNTIKHRQEMIQLFIDHPELQEKFEILIQQAVEHEAVLMKFMQKRFVMDIEGNPIKFIDQLQRRNVFMQLLEQGNKAINVGSAGMNMTAATIDFSSQGIDKALDKTIGANLDIVSNIPVINNEIKERSQLFQKNFEPMLTSAATVRDSFLKGYSSLSNLVYNNLLASGLLATGTAFLTKKISSQNLKKISLPAQALLAGSLLLATTQVPGMWDLGKASNAAFWAAYTTAAGAYSLYSHYVDAVVIRDSLYALSRLIDISQEIEDVCNQHGVDHQFKLSDIQSQDGVSLLEELQNDRYKEKDSNLFLTPLVHSFVFDVYENDINLSPIYASIAEIDVYVAIARKMTQLENSDHQLSFVQFLDDAQPKIQAQGFWNMLVTKGDVVTNNISEGRNIILTGSNEGGKTTTIRAILQNIVLAQTFGIAAASEFALTQFDVIHSYLNVSDDILNGKSRFASELKQAQDILTRIKALHATEKFFFAFDELFTGTNGEDGAECAYRFIDNVASYKGIQFIYATHFNKLKSIGSTNPACANYKIEPPLRDEKGAFIRDDKGQLIYPYKLSAGANDVNVAMDRAKDAGIFA